MLFSNLNYSLMIAIKVILYLTRGRAFIVSDIGRVNNDITLDRVVFHRLTGTFYWRQGIARALRPWSAILKIILIFYTHRVITETYFPASIVKMSCFIVRLNHACFLVIFRNQKIALNCLLISFRK